MAQNPLKYTGLTYTDIMDQISNLVASDPRFNNFRESTIAQFLLEMFAGTTDIMNYYLQRRAEECYFDSAKLDSSVISLSRMFGYDVTRPIPAKSKLTIRIKGLSTAGYVAGDQIYIQPYATFNGEGVDMVLQNSMIYEITSDDYTNIQADGDDYELVITTDKYGNDIDVVQGSIKETFIDGKTNPQIGSAFQSYKISDKTFSNVYGDQDYFGGKITKVYVGANKVDPTTDSEDSGTLFQIDRRSLINWENIAKSRSLDDEDGTKVCLVRTAPDGGVEIIFGDSVYARKGALTSLDNIYISYLSTLGKAGNRIGIIGNRVTFAGKIFGSKADLSDVNFEFGAGLVGGADIESKESIKYNSPKIYYSLDRVVTKADYANYLKSLTVPIDIRNAYAWGEQEQKRDWADHKMFNLVLFTALGSLYNTTSSPYSAKTGVDINTAVLDSTYDEDGINSQSFFNIYSKQAVVKQLKEYSTLPNVYYRVVEGVTDYTYESADAFKQALVDAGSSYPFLIEYTADKNMYGYGMVGTSAVPVTGLADVIGKGADKFTLDEYAAKLKTSLQVVVDDRGSSINILENGNYQQSAFTDLDVSITWDEISKKGTVRIVSDMSISPCYISKVDVSPVASALGLAYYASSVHAHGEHNATAFIERIQTQNQTETISAKISDVISALNNRAQVTISNVYVSPIIHSFELQGEVYVKPLYDKDVVRTEVCDAIYTWLDLNADFNQEIKKSNIIQIIEENPGVNFVDMNIVPSGYKTSYSVENDDRFGDATLTRDLLSAIYFGDVFNRIKFFGPFGFKFSTDVFTEKEFFDRLIVFEEKFRTNTLFVPADYEFVYVTSGSVNEIDYSINLSSGNSARESIKYIVNTLGIVPSYTDAFVEILNTIRKYFHWGIKSHLINANGNLGVIDIGEESKYSIGSEIAKIDCSPLVFRYR